MPFLSNILCNIAVGPYFFGNKGEKSCRGGKEITNNKKCRSACEALGLQVDWGNVNNGTVKDVCFRKSHDGKWCKKTGKDGGDAFWICKRGKIMTKTDVLNMTSLAKYNHSY